MTAMDAVLLIGGGVLAGVANTIAGGGSSVTLPLLLGVGLDAPVANGTNHVAHLVGALTRASVFTRSSVLGWRIALELTAPTLVGSLAGAWLATEIPAQDLRFIIMAAVLTGAIVLLVNPKRILHGDLQRKPRIGAVQVIVLVLVGVWSGFILVGAGTLQLLALTLGVGLALTPALAAKAIIGLLTMAVSVPLFIMSGEVAGLATLYVATGTAVGSGLTAWLATSGRAKSWLYALVVFLSWGEAIYLIVGYLGDGWPR